MSLASSINISPLDIPPQPGYELTEASLRLDDFLNNPRSVGKILPDAEMHNFIVEQGYGEQERALFSALGTVVLKNSGALSDREELKFSTTEYGDPVYSLMQKPRYEGLTKKVTSIIAVEGLFLFGHSHFVAEHGDIRKESDPFPLLQSDYNRFKLIGRIASINKPTLLEKLRKRAA